MDHNHAKDLTMARIFGAIMLNCLITVAEGIGGFLSGSLSLFSDAIHNFSDVIALATSGIALHIGRQPKTAHYTFGKKRFEILAATVNAVVLVVICIFLIKGAYDRLYNPSIPSGVWMIVIGTIGLAANFAGAMLLHNHTHNNLNIRSAYLHLFSDTVSSAGVIVGGVLIRVWSIPWIDPLITLCIAAYVLWESYAILKNATDIMMMAAPSSVSLEEVSAFIRTIPGIQNVHHMHLWQLSEEAIHFEAHVKVNDMTVSDTERILSSLEEELKQRFNISHITIQCECGRCESQSMIA